MSAITEPCAEQPSKNLLTFLPHFSPNPNSRREREEVQEMRSNISDVRYEIENVWCVIN